MSVRALLFALALVVVASACAPTWADEGLAALGIRVELRPGTAAVPEKMRSDLRPPGDVLPDGEFVVGLHDVAAAWLVGPTERYDHGVLGDAVEAGGLHVRLRDGRELDYRLPPDSVFEALRPWIADLDGDGRDEIIVVRSYLDAGAALAVFAVEDGRIVPRAQTDPIGRPYRWLNPAGVGDFDGDGGLEIAYVETPHIGGILHILSLEGGRLRREGRLRGFSNHAMGSRALGLSAVLDLDGDGAEELLLPAADRRKLRLISFAGGRFRELGTVTHGAAIVTDFQVRDRDGNGRADVAYGLADGTLVELLR
jgi:hypothetical protein